MPTLQVVRSRPTDRTVTPLWDVARPSRPLRAPGVAMAGFGDVGAAPAELRMVPHPAVTLAIGVGDDPLVVGHGAERSPLDGLVAGLAPEALPVRTRGLRALQVRLSPLVAAALLGVSAAELAHRVVRLDDVWGPDAARVGEMLREAATWDDRFAIVDDVLLRRYEDGPAVDPEVVGAWARLAASDGRARVDELAAESGWSRKRLWARFRSQIGLSPKRAATLVRFDRAAHHLAAGRSPADVAAEVGYADQPHLHRDVRAFAGTTPAGVAVEPWLAVDDVAWPARVPSPTRTRR